MDIIQVHTESGRVSLDRSLVESSGMLVVLVLEKGSDPLRLMRPAECWSRLTFPPQGWRDEASAASVEIKISEEQREDLIHSMILYSAYQLLVLIHCTYNSKGYIKSTDLDHNDLPKRHLSQNKPSGTIMMKAQ